VYYYTRQIKKTAAGGLGNDTLNVAGIRAGGDIKPIAGLGYNLEVYR